MFKARNTFRSLVQASLTLVGFYFVAGIFQGGHAMQLNQLLDGMIFNFDRQILGWAEAGRILPLALTGVGILTLTLLALLMPLLAGRYVIRFWRLK